MKMLLRLLYDEKGATAIEYGLIALLISISIIASLQIIANNFINSPMATVSAHLTR